MTESSYHTPIMLPQTLEFLNPSDCRVTVDCTLGGGGHSEGILELLPPGAIHFGIDRDGDAIAAASKRLEGFSSFHAIRGNFFDMKRLLPANGCEIGSVDGMLMDLGVSSHQLDDAQRGFSYGAEAPLDMRMDRDSAFSAYDVVNDYSLDRLYEVIKDYGEERFAYRIAKGIVTSRGKRRIETTTELAGIIKNSIPAAARREGPHPARRTFQAIRIEVNGELKELNTAIRDAVEMLAPSGILAVISFHSLEDRIVKNVFKDLKNPCTCPSSAPICVCGRKPEVEILTGKPIVADDAEVERNPRSRSAKLRAIKKLITN